MTALRDVAHARSKNAGPFWLTIDIFFDAPDAYARFKDSPALAAEAVARLYGVDPASMKRFAVDDLQVVKLSFPRPAPQGGVIERDMHGGQQYVRLLGLGLD